MGFVHFLAILMIPAVVLMINFRVLMAPNCDVPTEDFLSNFIRTRTKRQMQKQNLDRFLLSVFVSVSYFVMFRVTPSTTDTVFLVNL